MLQVDSTAASALLGVLGAKEVIAAGRNAARRAGLDCPRTGHGQVLAQGAHAVTSLGVAPNGARCAGLQRGHVCKTGRRAELAQHGRSPTCDVVSTENRQ